MRYPVRRRLCRSKRPVIGGVCGGLAEYFGVRSVLVRLLWMMLTGFGGSGAFVYALLWLFLPKCSDHVTPISSVEPESI